MEERDREVGSRLPSIGSLPKWLQHLRLGQAKARSPDSAKVERSKYLAHPPLSSQAPQQRTRLKAE